MTKERNQNNEACFIHMDSLNMHKTNSISLELSNYLSCEWKHKKLNISISEMDKKNLFEELPCFCPVHPVQTNGYDCGVFVFKYVEKVMEILPSTKYKDRKLKLKDQFSATMLAIS